MNDDDWLQNDSIPLTQTTWDNEDEEQWLVWWSDWMDLSKPIKYKGIRFDEQPELITIKKKSSKHSEKQGVKFGSPQE